MTLHSAVSNCLTSLGKRGDGKFWEMRFLVGTGWQRNVNGAWRDIPPPHTPDFTPTDSVHVDELNPPSGLVDWEIKEFNGSQFRIIDSAGNVGDWQESGGEL